MKKETKDFEAKKTRVYHKLLQIITGLILVWCVLWFIPVESFFDFSSKVFSNYSADVSVTAALAIIVALSFLVFAFGYYCIQWCLTLGTSSKHEEVKKEVKPKTKKQIKEVVEE